MDENGKTHVYPRDASWHVSPNVAWKLHWSKPEDLALSACGKSVLILEDPWDPNEIPHDERCRRPGCRQRWKAWDDKEKKG